MYVFIYGAEVTERRRYEDASRDEKRQYKEEEKGKSLSKLNSRYHTLYIAPQVGLRRFRMSLR